MAAPGGQAVAQTLFSQANLLPGYPLRAPHPYCPTNQQKVVLHSFASCRKHLPKLPRSNGILVTRARKKMFCSCLHHAFFDFRDCARSECCPACWCLATISCKLTFVPVYPALFQDLDFPVGAGAWPATISAGFLAPNCGFFAHPELGAMITNNLTAMPANSDCRSLETLRPSGHSTNHRSLAGDAATYASSRYARQWFRGYEARAFRT